MQSRCKAAFLIIVLAIGTACMAVLFEIYQVALMPDEYMVIKGEEKWLSLNLPFGALAATESEGISPIDDLEVITGKAGIGNKRSFQIETTKTGNKTIEFKLFGLVPVKKMVVSIISPVKVIPGGHSIGVKLYTQGVLVVALADFTTVKGKVCNPAAEAGISVGDSIISIDDTKVRDADHVIQLLGKCKEREITIEINRGGKKLIKNVRPLKNQEDGKHRIGAWVRDKTAGVGTLSFYYPGTEAFGALGHGITDVDTGLMLSIEEGEILESRIASIQKGERSKPGEIRGVFFEEQNKLGDIYKNTEFGIFGTLCKTIKNEHYKEPIPVALYHQVREGPAYMLTTVDEEIGMYSIVIQKVSNQHNPEPKSMVIKIVDNRLLETSGGIVQGMSGSPIIQDNKLAGVVTHVFVNDPTRGYGIFAEWMTQNMGL